MPRLRNMLFAALAIPVLALGAVACNDDADSDSSASAQNVDEINARVQRNEQVTAILGMTGLPLHDIDEAVSAGDEIPSNAIPSMRTVVRLMSITNWDSSLQEDADAIEQSAEDFIAAAESDDHAGAAEAATEVHEGWHEFSEAAWEVVAPGTGGDDHDDEETPHGEETPHDEGTPHDDGAETPEATP